MPELDDSFLRADQDELPAIQSLSDQIAISTDVQLSLGTTAPQPLPPTVATALRRVLVLLGRGRIVAVQPYDDELTSQEAANLLNVSRPHLNELVDSGRIPGAYKVGEGARAHRRIPLNSVLAYREWRSRRVTETRELETSGAAAGSPRPTN